MAMTAVPTTIIENLRKAWMPFESDRDVTRVFLMMVVGTAVMANFSDIIFIFVIWHYPT